MTDAITPGFICYGLPSLTVYRLIDGLSDLDVHWLVCDSDMDALSALGTRYADIGTVSICLLPGLTPTYVAAVQDIVRREAEHYSPPIWLFNESELLQINNGVSVSVGVPLICSKGQADFLFFDQATPETYSHVIERIRQHIECKTGLAGL